MLKIIFYCYSRGIITSRPIEYACKTNIVVKVLARDAEPDHDTIAHFISSQAEAVKSLFAQILLKCYALGLIGGELFAIDGCKLPSALGFNTPPLAAGRLIIQKCIYKTCNPFF
jgi:transposase